MPDMHAWAIPPTLPTPKVCSLVEADVGLLQLVSTLAGHGGMQVAHSAAQHSFHDLHEVSGFSLIIHHTNLCTATTLPLLEAAGQGQALRDRTWQSEHPQNAPHHLSDSPAQNPPVTAQLPEAGGQGRYPLILASRGTTSSGSGLSL